MMPLNTKLIDTVIDTEIIYHDRINNKSVNQVFTLLAKTNI